MNMKKPILGALAAALGLSACVVTSRPGPDYVIAPALPVVVELEVAPYYYGGFYYYYRHPERRWVYARDKRGPWHELPPDRYPREIRYRDHDRDRDRDRDR